MFAQRTEERPRSSIDHQLANKSAMTSLLRMWLRPMVRMLVRAGYGYRDLNEVVKMTYVETATQEYGLRGRPTNVSRVAIMTGLTRREVSRLRNVLESTPQEMDSMPNVAQKVLNTWCSDTRFLNQHGCPRRLALQGNGSLGMLIDEIKGDIPSSAILNELQRSQCIEMRGDGAVMSQAVYQPAQDAPKALLCLADLGQALASTRHHQDLTLHDKQGTRVELSSGDVDELRQLLDRGARSVIKDMRCWLASRR